MKKIAFILAALAAFALVGCADSSPDSTTDTTNTGSLSITITEAVSKTIAPSTGTTVSSYTVTGSGPSGASFSITITSGTAASVTDLIVGEWTITVVAYNSDGVALGGGTGTTSVIKGTTSTTSIDVSSFSGDGTLKISLSWTSSLSSPSVTCYLTPLDETIPINLSFVIDSSSSSASFSSSEIPAGLYTMNLTLTDTAGQVGSCVDTVLVLQDMVTSGTYNFDPSTSYYGKIALTVTSSLLNTFTVSITGDNAKVASNTLELTASVPGYSDLTYTWYVDGTQVATGATWTMDTAWEEGSYRIDVAAVSSSLLKAGSATTTITVTALPSLEYILNKDGTAYSVAQGTVDTSGEVVVPASRDGLPVVAIANGAFSGAASMTSITLPSTITTIGSKAFYGCTSLTSITIPEGVTSIGDYAFYKCTYMASASLPPTLATIGNYAFYSCCRLTNMTLPDSLTAIGNSAFFYCGITSIVIPAGVSSIPSSTFYNCFSLSVVSLSEGVASINSYAFYGCTSLTSITIPDSVTSIPDYAFYNCKALASISLPKYLTSIGSHAFNLCTSLSSIVMPDTVTTVGSYAFQSCSALKSVALSENLQSMAQGIFNGCTFTQLTIPASVTSISYSSLGSCYYLHTITIDPSTPPLLDGTFTSVSTLSAIKVPAASVDAYKAAAGWSAYADIISAQ